MRSIMARRAGWRQPRCYFFRFFTPEVGDPTPVGLGLHARVQTRIPPGVSSGLAGVPAPRERMCSALSATGISTPTNRLANDRAEFLVHEGLHGFSANVARAREQSQHVQRLLLGIGTDD